MPDPCHAVQILRDTASIEAFVPEWTALWHSDPNRTPFQHPAWLVPWWHHFGQPDLRCLIVRSSQGNLKTLLPFYVLEQQHTAEPDSKPGVLQVPCAGQGFRKLLPVGAGTSDYLDGLFAPDCTVADVIAALQVLQEEGGFDTLDVVQLRPESLLVHALRELGAAQTISEPTSVMPAAALAELPPKIRRNAMYYRNRAERGASLELRFATARDCHEQFDTLVCLHGTRWRERGEPGVLDDPAVLAWHREVLPLLAGAGLLRLASLTRNGEPLGLMYALADDAAKQARTLYLYLPAFSLEHRDLRPGTVLLALMIDAVARKGFATVDMLRGGEAYKQLWHVAMRETLALTLKPEQP